ncbi:uncharacterized protein [Equus caballus]|uniref:uncharacterized protein isoform X4 n=1 Tax=Equus caballus TaxID=9796 RepID=UPI0038B3DFC4
MSTVCVLKVGAFWACSLQKGLQQDRIACLAGQVRLPAPADIFESAERNYWDQRCPDTTASFEAMETWSWQWLSSLRRMPRPLSRRRQLTTKPRFLAVIDTSVWEAKQMRVPGPGIETASAPPKSVLSSSVETEGHLRSWPPEHSLHSPAFFPSKCSSVTNCLSIGHEGKGYVNLQAEI